MDLYQLTFAVLVVCSCGLAYTQHRSDLKSDYGDQPADINRAAKRFRWLFIPVYLLVMGSDWLQVRPRSPLSDMFQSIPAASTDA